MHINIKAMLAMIKDEPEDKYIPVLKPVLEALLNENKMLRRKNSQLGGKVARMRIPMISNIKRMMKKWKQEQLN